MASPDDVEIDFNESMMSYTEDGWPIHKMLSSMIDSNEDKSFWDNRNFKRHETEGSTLLCIVTHEMRSSITSEILAPFSRINDGKMHIMEFKK